MKRVEWMGGPLHAPTYTDATCVCMYNARTRPDGDEEPAAVARWGGHGGVLLLAAALGGRELGRWGPAPLASLLLVPLPPPLLLQLWLMDGCLCVGGGGWKWVSH